MATVITRSVTASSAFEASTLVRAVPGTVLVRHITDMHDGTFDVCFDFVGVS